MQRAVFLSITVGLVILGLSDVACAQSLPQTAGLTPLQIQRFSRDLIPSSSQDFFRAGQVDLEREVQTLTRRRSRSNENLLKISQSAKHQSDEQSEPFNASPGEQVNTK